MPGALLVSFGGYPYTPSSLTPDNGLANLAGALAEEGWDAHIRDFGTISTMRRLFPRELTEQLKPHAEEMLGGAGGELDDATRSRLRELDRALERHQRVEIAQIAEEVADEVRRLRPEFVGMKLWNGDGFTGSVTIAERLRDEFPHMAIYGGGPQASWWRSAIFDYTRVFDCILQGEGELSIRAIARHALGKADLADIPGVIYLDGEQVREVPRDDSVDMNDLPEPVYHEDVYPAMAGDEKIKIIVIDDSRGCPHQCGFCAHPVESGHRLRTADPAVLADRMQAMVERYDITAFRFSGSSTPGRLMAEVSDEILERGLDVTFACFGHFASARPDHFERMADAGLYAIFFGIESGCQEVLDTAVRKGIDLGKVAETVRRAQEAGIFVVTSMIVPLPGDTPDTIARSLNFMREIKPDAVPIQIPGLIPGTPWWEHPSRYGFEFDYDELTEVELDYKIKLLFPPSMWEPLPYRVDGKSFSEFSAETMRFTAELERSGILTMVPDDMALIARCAQMPARQFRDLSRLWCSIGDAEAMGEMVARANRMIVRDR